MNAKSERVLSRWGLLMVGKHGPIIAGCQDMEIRRTSTPLVTFDPETLTGVTASGRPYRLVGEPEPGYALGAFHSLWDAGETPVRVISPAEAFVMVEREGNRPVEFTPEQQVRLERLKLRLLAAQMAHQIGIW